MRHDIVLELAAAMLVVGWIMVLAAIGFGGELRRLWTAGILFAGALASLWLRRGCLRLAPVALIAALVAAMAYEKWLFPASLVQFYFPIVVVVSSLLVSSLGVFAVATLAVAACSAVARVQGVSWLDSTQVVTPALLVYLTAFAAWLGSRQMHMALGWMQSSYAQARDLLEEVRERRMSLARTLRALEDAYVRIERMNDALIEARRVAEEARRMKAEFAASVSHELRTPLNIILGFSETMANAPETYANVVWTPLLRGDIEQIYRSSRHLSALIDDILDLSALDAHHLGLIMEEADMASVIAEAVAVVENLFRAKDLYLAVDVAPDLPRVRIDPLRIRQVLINLLANASRFTHTGGVRITCRMTREGIEVAVADTGEGIAPQDVARVFEDFSQVDGSTARTHDGTGLGVPLSRRLVQLHGGRMWLRSELGKGTTFFFTLPVTARAWSAGTRTDKPPFAAPDYRRTVLVMGHDSLALHTLRRHLGQCDVVEVADPAVLPAMVEQYHPAALVVNCDSEAGWIGPERAALPDDLPVIAVSLPRSLRSAQALGIERVLVKPVTREQLLAAISDLGYEVRSVLIVDDDPQLVELFGRMLQSAGYRTLKAFGGAEALARLRQQRVDLVILDILMADVGGLEVLREMKADPSIATVPVIVASAHYPESARAAGGLFIQLARARDASVTETLTALEALLAVLPPRGLPEIEAEPAPPATPGDRPAS